jgi:acetyltransferase-like isoleucine patch superfamily enzyme
MKKKFKKIVKRIAPQWVIEWYYIIKSVKEHHSQPSPDIFGKCSSNVVITNSYITAPQNVFLQNACYIFDPYILNREGKVIIKKYCVLRSPTIVADIHSLVVGVPQALSGFIFSLDKVKDVVIEEDVWVGINVTLLGGAHVGRGAVIGACSLINKEIPPYAVVAGFPAKIIAVKFTLEEIIEHERILYPPEERFSREYLEQLFRGHYQGMKSIGISELTEEQKIRLEELKTEHNVATCN